MNRRIPAALAAIATAAIVLAGCGGGSQPALSDPKEILTESAKTLPDAKTVHFQLDLEGQLPFDLSGMLGGGDASPAPSASSPSLDIGGTTVSGDVDIAAGKGHVTFAIPALLNTSGDLIAADDKLYVKVSLLGDQYHVLDSSSLAGMLPGDLPIPSFSPEPSASASPDASAMIDELQQALDGLTTPPAKLADETCGDTTCYHVQIKLDASDEGAIASLAPDLQGTGTLDVYVRQNDRRPSRLILTADGGDQGTLTATLTLSDWDKSVDIQAPPADQITDQPISLPGLTG